MFHLNTTLIVKSTSASTRAVLSVQFSKIAFSPKLYSGKAVAYVRTPSTEAMNLTIHP